MGYTNHSGPLYGAETILAVGSGIAASMAAAANAVEFHQTTVPATEDWYATRCEAYCTLTGNGGTCDIKDDGTSILTSVMTLAAAANSTGGAITADQGEVGKKIAASSAVTFHGSVGATTAATDVRVVLFGYKRRV